MGTQRKLRKRDVKELSKTELEKLWFGNWWYHCPKKEHSRISGDLERAEK